MPAKLSGDPLAAFRRVTVADQAANALREALRQRTLPDPLPGEHHLARLLGISRVSLRSAVAQLVREGLISRSNGRRSRVNPSTAPRPNPVPPTVCVVCPLSRKVLLANELILELHAACAAKGMRWEEAFDAKLDVARPERQLRALVNGRTHVCWVLLACSAPIQHWFARAGVPTFLLGSCQPGVALPSIDFDFHATGWHAAGALIQHRHRHIALLQSHRLLAGDLETCKGFLGYLAKSAAGATVTRVFVNADQSNLRPRLDQLMKLRHRPTAIFSLRPDFAITTMVHLHRSGLRIPEDVSLLSRDSHPLIDSALPEISRYHGSDLLHSDRAVRFAEALLAGHGIPPKPKLFIPTFIAGRTLADRREPAAKRPVKAGQM